MIRMTQELISNAPQDPAIAKSFTKSVNSITSRLDALVHSATAAGDGSHFPEKENIGPNQLSWPETAAQMGVKRANKGKGGKVDSALTAQHIGEPNRKHAAGTKGIRLPGEGPGVRRVGHHHSRSYAVNDYAKIQSLVHRAHAAKRKSSHTSPGVNPDFGRTPCDGKQTAIRTDLAAVFVSLT